MKYVVFDLETTTRAPEPHFSATPHGRFNEIVMAGFLGPGIGIVTVDGARLDTMVDILADTEVIVGHNVKFDILHLCAQLGSNPGQLAHMHGRNIRLWDTSIAEYVIESQRVRMPSLDKCAAKYHAPLKDATVSDLIKSGVCPSEINPVLLRKYLEGDLIATEQVFLHQYRIAKEMGLLKVIWSTMEALWATTEMQYNGMAVSIPVLNRYESEWCARVEAIDIELREFSGSVDVCRDYPSFSFDSPTDLSCFLFGGSRKVSERVEAGLYKNGNPRYKTITKSITYAGLGLVPDPEKETKRDGVYSVDDSVLEKLSGHHPCVSLLREKRHLSKLLGTYGKPIRTKVVDGVLHGQLHHNVTGTGRLSSSDPNMQNMPNHEFKRCFVSRYGPNGLILEVDFDQLEMIGLAIMSKCPVLTSDIRDGRDMHIELFKEMFGRVPTKSERKDFKPLSFGLVYGAGAYTLAANSGMSLGEVKRFIKVFYDRYFGVAAWHKQQIEEAKANRKPSARRDAHGVPLGKYEYVSPFGRRYTFYEYRNDRGEYSFSPPELKNWPVQGAATADVVPFLLGRLFRFLYSHWYEGYMFSGKIAMINTIHDSIMFDVRNETAANELAEALRIFFSDARRMVQEYYDVNQPLEYSVGIECGPNWFDKKEI